MNNKTKNILIAVLLIGIISMSIVYASLSQTLNINGSATVQSKSETWNVHFTRVTSGNEVVISNYATSESNTLTFDGTSTTVTLPLVTLKAPGDSVTFYFDVINEGDVTAKLTTINQISIPVGSYGSGETLSTTDKTTLQNSITGTLTLADGTALTTGTTLAKGERMNLKVTITFLSSCTVLPSTDYSISNITASLIFTQN